MGRKPLVIVLGALAVLALVLRRRRARPAPPLPPPAPKRTQDDGRESLRRFVEAGERVREGEQASPEL
jgi:hypothetical protein